VKSNPETGSSGSLLVTAADFANLSLLEPYAPLQRLLKTARVVASDDMPHDVVTMNTQVVLRDEMSGERWVVRVVFPGDADPARDQISVLEPLGVRLLGKSPADVIDCEFADGVHRLRVELVIYQPEHSLRTNLVVRPLTRSGE
jgi:regulator of nucleoside diphosphate kinase